MQKLKTLFFTSLLCMQSIVYGQEGASTMPTRDQSIYQTFIMLAIAMVFFYLILWRPEQKRRKEMDQKRASLKKGDSVVAMGILGTVHRVGESTVVLKMVDGNKIEFLKAAITDSTPEQTASEVDVEVEEIQVKK
jgi:preprotein translocase subunit YajC